MLKPLANIIISLATLEELRHRTVPQQPKHCQLIFSSAAQSLCEWWTTTNRVLWPVLFIYAYMRVKLVKTVSTRYLYLWNCRQTDRQTENLARRTTTTTDRPEECKAHKATIHTPTEGRRPETRLLGTDHRRQSQIHFMTIKLKGRLITDEVERQRLRESPSPWVMVLKYIKCCFLYSMEEMLDFWELFVIFK